MRLSRILKALLFAVITVILTMALDTVLELNESDTEEMLIKFADKESIDTVFVGNSAGKMLNPDIYENLTGSPAVNMCTPSQSYNVTLENIKLAYARHKIKKVVLLTTFDTFDDASPEVADHIYHRVINSSGTWFENVTDTVAENIKKESRPGIVNKEESINMWIPWVVETAPTFKDIKENITRRLLRIKNHTPLGAFFPYDFHEVIYEYKEDNLTKEDEDIIGEFENVLEGEAVLDEYFTVESLESLAGIIVFCRENGIEFEMIITPHRTDYYDRNGAFGEVVAASDELLRDFVTSFGYRYYNVEEDEQVHEILPDEYFYDWEHVSEEYRGISTEYLTNIIKK